MVDSGAQAEIISPELVRRLGGTVAQGRFGVAVEAFGRETPLTQQARGIELRLPGTNPRSLLSQDFLTQWDFIVAPQGLSSEYDILLGTRFLRRFRLNLTFYEPCVIRLTASDGGETQLTEEVGFTDDDEECIQQERVSGSEQHTRAAAVATNSALAPSPCQSRRPLTHSQRRALLREWRQGEEGRLQQAALALQDPATRDYIMSMAELEQLWATSKPGAVKIFMIQARGFVEGLTEGAAVTTARKDGVRVAAVETESSESGSDGSLLPAQERQQAQHVVSKLQREFADVFPEELPSGVPPQRGSEPFRIDLKEGTKPMGRYGPRMTEENTRVAGKMIKELLDKGFIRPSRSPWGSPMFLVDKPDGGKRMVIDYRTLNAATTRNRYPLPRIDELFDQLQGARYFSKLDLRTGYWQIRVAAEDVAKTAFTSRHGHFEWLVLPMGLTNAPAEFMALMENTFREELNKFVLVFLDDILVYSRTMEEHERHLRVVLQRLREQKLYGKLSKCVFFRQEVEFLGHFVGRAGVRMVEGKVAAVERWPTPATQKEVEQFLGLAGYYRRFIADFSKIASPLSELCGTLKKSKSGAERRPPKKRFTWGPAQQQAFEQLKTAVVSAPCLAIPDPQREFIVHTDASGYATGAVLMQQFSEGLRPIAFLSKKMSTAERNYPVHEQELLAILNALKAWRHYLGGRRFTVLTDHQSLQYVETSAMATPRQMRWAAWLSEFDFSIRYGRGEANVAADALSRGAAGKAPVNSTSGVTGQYGEEARSLGLACVWERDEAGERLLVSSINELAPLPVRIREAAAADSEYRALLQLSSDSLARQQLSRSRGLLYRRSEDGSGEGGQLVIPKSGSLRTWLLSSAHDSLLGAHHSGATTSAWLRERVWWSGMAAEAERYVRGCESCQRNKPDLRGRQGLPLSVETPSRAWEVVCMDFIGPLPRTARGYDTVLVVIEKLTRWVYYIPTRSTATAQDVFALLDRFVLANHDTPRQIISDRDSRFTSHFWEDLWAAMRTQLKRSTAFHPQTDGQTERANRTLIEQLRSHVDEHQADWDLLLPQLQRANNSAVCVSTGFSPFEMNYGRSVRTELDAELERDGAGRQREAYPGAAELAQRREQVEAQARERISKAQAKQRKDASQGRRAPDIGVGDRVWLSNRNLRLDERGRARKLESLYFGPYDVLEMHGSNAARLRMPEGCRLHPVFNLDLLRKFVDGRSEFPERPVRDHRPGPVPEEDPQAGGPGEPEYEVEAIIGSRGRGARMSYRVKWLGWPVEQASWCPAAECRRTCPERVREFEEQQLRRLQAVHVLRRVEVERREQRVRWSSLDIRQHEESHREPHERHRPSQSPQRLSDAGTLCLAVLRQYPDGSATKGGSGAAVAWTHPRRPLLQRELRNCVGQALQDRSDTRKRTATVNREQFTEQHCSQQARMGERCSWSEQTRVSEAEDSTRSSQCMVSAQGATSARRLDASDAHRRRQDSVGDAARKEQPCEQGTRAKQQAGAYARAPLVQQQSVMEPAQERSTHEHADDVSGGRERACADSRAAASPGEAERTDAGQAATAVRKPWWGPAQGGCAQETAREHEDTLSRPPRGFAAGSTPRAADTKEPRRVHCTQEASGHVRASRPDHVPAAAGVDDRREDVFAFAPMLLPKGGSDQGAARSERGDGDGGGRGEDNDAESAGMQGSAARGSAVSPEDLRDQQQQHAGGTHMQAEVSRGGRGGTPSPLHAPPPGGRRRSRVGYHAPVVPVLP